MSQLPTYPRSDANQCNSQKHLLLIDTDIGDDIDDALALALALCSPEIKLLGVTTVFGDTQKRAQLAAHLLSVFECEDIPVAAGLSMPLQLQHQPPGVPQAAILENSQKIPQLSTFSGPELIVQTALAHAGHLTLLCIGPLTNIATALLMEPRLSLAIRRIILMGGTSGIPFPEWNVRSDVLAAQKVLATGIPVMMLGWNVTTRCQLQARNIEQLRSHESPQTQLLSQLLMIWQQHRKCLHPRLPYLHDPLTIVALCASELLRFQEMKVRVFRHGPLKGFMIPRARNGSLVQAAVDIDAEKARTWIMQRLLFPLHTQSS